VRERLRRGLNFELDSVREQLNSLGEESSPAMWRRTAGTRDRCLTWGSRHGFGQDAKRERFGEKRYWLTDGASVQPPRLT